MTREADGNTLGVLEDNPACSEEDLLKRGETGSSLDEVMNDIVALNPHISKEDLRSRFKLSPDGSLRNV